MGVRVGGVGGDHTLSVAFFHSALPAHLPLWFRRNFGRVWTSHTLPCLTWPHGHPPRGQAVWVTLAVARRLVSAGLGSKRGSAGLGVPHRLPPRGHSSAS